MITNEEKQIARSVTARALIKAKETEQARLKQGYHYVQTENGTWKLKKIKYKCSYCGRCFIDKIPHKCNNGFRKRNNKWTAILEQ